LKRSTFVDRPPRFIRARSRLRLAVVGAGAHLAAGCHSYVPTDLPAVPEGQVVRLMVTRAGSEEVARAREVDELSPTVYGQLVRRESETVLLRIPVDQRTTAAQGGFRLDLGQVVRIPEGEVLAVARQEFSATKTLGLAAATAAAAGFLLYQIFDAFSDTGSDGDDPVLIRIPIPIG